MKNKSITDFIVNESQIDRPGLQELDRPAFKDLIGN